MGRHGGWLALGIVLASTGCAGMNPRSATYGPTARTVPAATENTTRTGDPIDPFVAEPTRPGAGLGRYFPGLLRSWEPRAAAARREQPASDPIAARLSAKTDPAPDSEAYALEPIGPTRRAPARSSPVLPVALRVQAYPDEDLEPNSEDEPGLSRPASDWRADPPGTVGRVARDDQAQRIGVDVEIPALTTTSTGLLLTDERPLTPVAVVRPAVVRTGTSAAACGCDPVLAGRPHLVRESGRLVLPVSARIQPVQATGPPPSRRQANPIPRAFRRGERDHLLPDMPPVQFPRTYARVEPEAPASAPSEDRRPFRLIRRLFGNRDEL
jgi:hypothetical protein